MIRLSIEIPDEGADGLREANLSIKGHGRDLLVAYGLLTRGLSETLGVAVPALAAQLLAQARTIDDSVVESTRISAGGWPRKEAVDGESD